MKMNLPLDKQAHILGGLYIATITFIATSNLLFAFLAAFAVAVLKEVYDYFHPKSHSCDIYDAIATAFGGAVGVLVIFLVKHYVG